MAGLVFILSTALLYQSCQNHDTVTEESSENPADLNVEILVKEPDVINPMTMAVDEEGSIYVSLSHTYRYGIEGSPYDSISNPIKKITLDENGEVLDVITVAEGFNDPVMGICIDEDKLFITNLNQLSVLKLDENHQVIGKEVLVQDSEIPWNPFGMYRIIIGPDDKLWFSVADRPSSDPVTLTGTDGKTVRLSGQSGGILRCDKDGSNLEVLVEGLRAPYAFEVDPWGHLMVVSNGEGSPNIYFDAIFGMDYGYHSRDVTYNWLAGNTTLSPPVVDMGPGANTATLSYRSSHFPKKYGNDIFMPDWGNHGFNPSNRLIKRIPDSKLPNIRSSDTTALGIPFFRPRNDSLFRPTDIKLLPEGSMIVSDWQGRDDESNRMGRIYRISYENQEHKNERQDLNQLKSILAQEKPIDLLDHSNHWVRQQIVKYWVEADSIPEDLFKLVLTQGSSIASANALWILSQRRDASASDMMELALFHEDARVRAMSIRQLRQEAGLGLVRDNRNSAMPYSQEHKYLDDLVTPFLEDPAVEVRIEAALTLFHPKAIVRGLLKALELAEDKFSIYRIGFELGKFCDAADLEELYISFGPKQKTLLGVCGETILQKRPELSYVVEKWDIPALKFKDLADQLVNQVRSGKGIQLKSEKLMVINRINEYPMIDTAFQDFILECLTDENELLKKASLRAIRNGSFYRDDLVEATIMTLSNSEDSLVKMEALHTGGSFPEKVHHMDWAAMLEQSSGSLTITILRMLRDNSDAIQFKDQMKAALTSIFHENPTLREEVLFTSKAMGFKLMEKEGKITDPGGNKDLNEIYPEINQQLGNASVARGELVFHSDRATCSTCHSTNENVEFGKIGPNLSSIGTATQSKYLMESVLEPSKVIKTGYDMEKIETIGGEIWVGVPESKVDEVIIHMMDDEIIRLKKSDIKNRTKIETSLMPGGYENRMTILEIADLVKYLMSLKSDAVL